MSKVKRFRTAGATNNALAYKRVDREKETIMNFAVAVLAEVAECAKQEDAPLYEGDRVVDSFVRLSDVNDAINKHLNEMVN